MRCRSGLTPLILVFPRIDASFPSWSCQLPDHGTALDVLDDDNVDIVLRKCHLSRGYCDILARVGRFCCSMDELGYRFPVSRVHMNIELIDCSERRRDELLQGEEERNQCDRSFAPARG